MCNNDRAIFFLYSFAFGGLVTNVCSGFSVIFVLFGFLLCCRFNIHFYHTDAPLVQMFDKSRMRNSSLLGPHPPARSRDI